MLFLADVEEITKKTGHFQAFHEFVRMLCDAIQQERGLLDILNYSDLLALKARHKAAPDAAAANASKNNRRYMILTHFARERVHYPLPLAPESRSVAPVLQNGAPNPGLARSILPPDLPIAHQYAAVHRTTAAPVVEHAGQSGGNGMLLTRQYDELLREKEEIQAAYERLLRESTREIAKVRRRCVDLAGQLQEQSDTMVGLRGELMAHGGDVRIVESLKRKLKRAEEGNSAAIEKVQRSLDKHKKEVILLNAELSRSKRDEERMRRHVRQLEAELKTTQRRNAASGMSSARSGGSSRASSATASSRANTRQLPPSQLSREPLAARSTASSRASSVASRASSVASSTAASRAGSVERNAGSSRNSSRFASRPASRAGSSPASRASSAGPASSRNSSVEHSRPPSRDSRSGAHASAAPRNAAKPPSLQRAAREALLQTAQRGSRAVPSGAKGDRPAAPLARMGSARRSGGNGPRSDGGHADGDSSDEWLGVRQKHRARGQQRGNVTAASHEDGEAHKENRARHEQPRAASKQYPARPSSSVSDAAGDGAADEVDETRDVASPSYDATDDIQDIDRRLNALQQFLVAAKAPR